ncbi:glutathione S-transferase [Sphingomonas sp. UYAg733]
MYDLYHSPNACSMAVHAVLLEISVFFRLHRVSVLEGETSTPACLAINPKGRVPLLAFAGSSLTEVPAILTYLADAHPQSAGGGGFGHSTADILDVTKRS